MNKVVIVTGATGGLGSAIAKRFGADGDKVVINYTKSARVAEDIAREINSGSGQALPYQADVRNFAQVKKMIDNTIAKWNRIDVLVNAAGGPINMVGRPYLIHEMEEEMWDVVIDSNLKGTFHCIKAVLPHMMKQKDGHIINIASGMGISGVRGQANYAAAKAGTLGLSKTAAIEAGEYNIKVNALCPGLIMHERLAVDYPPEKFEMVKNMGVLHRTGDPEEFANFVFHITTMKNISGQTINLDSRILF